MDINILTETQLSQIRELIVTSQKIVICCHKSPDGDALGSSLGLAEYLRTQGKQPLVAVPDAFPDFLKWLPGADKTVRYDKHKDIIDAAFAEADLVFCLDFNDTKRVAEMEEPLLASKAQKILVDHHLEPTVECTLEVSRPSMSSTSEIIFRLIWQLGDFESQTKATAIPIYCGMMTDTGGFTYNSSRPEIFFIISQLLTKKFDKDKIYRNVYNNYSDWCIRLRGYIMFQKLNVLPSCHASYFTITREDMRRFHFIKGDAEGLVNEPLRIRGMRLAISLREDTDKDNKIWVSLRSVDNFYCNKLAEEFFNGGGHPNAAGGHLDCSMTEAEQITRAAIAKFGKM